MPSRIKKEKVFCNYFKDIFKGFLKEKGNIFCASSDVNRNLF